MRRVGRALSSIAQLGLAVAFSVFMVFFRLRLRAIATSHRSARILGRAYSYALGFLPSVLTSISTYPHTGAVGCVQRGRP